MRKVYYMNLGTKNVHTMNEWKKRGWDTKMVEGFLCRVEKSACDGWVIPQLNNLIVTGKNHYVCI